MYIRASLNRGNLELLEMDEDEAPPDIFQRIDSERNVSTPEISQLDGTDDERTGEDDDDDMWYEALTPTKSDHE